MTSLFEGSQGVQATVRTTEARADPAQVLAFCFAFDVRKEEGLYFSPLYKLQRIEQYHFKKIRICEIRFILVLPKVYINKYHC